jgi:DNA-binding MarR family transcriptional regulator
MTALLDRLERDDLVTRVSDSEDRRAQRVQLTAAGAAVQRPAMTAVQQCFDEVLDGLADERLEEMMDVLRAILRNTERGVMP